MTELPTAEKQGFPAAQERLSREQTAAFYHDLFVEDQTRHFLQLVGPRADADRRIVADVGGGCGFFARSLADAGQRVRVIDLDPGSLDACRRAGVEAVQGDALDPPVMGDEEIASFNLILHHLVGPNERATKDLQRRALARWRGHARAIFVNEYIYESWVGNLSGWLIFQITKSRILSALGRALGTVVPSLRANTFGVGVRFRAHQEWVREFAAAGYIVKSTVIGDDEPVAAPWRLLLIRSIRRDSFLLEPRSL